MPTTKISRTSRSRMVVSISAVHNFGNPNYLVRFTPPLPSYLANFSTDQKNIPQQIATVVSKWDTGSPECSFRYYFYNKVGEDKAPYFRPTPNEDPKAWEEALSRKPGPGYIPVLCTGFAQMGERIKVQQQNLASFNQKLHEINNSLEAMLSRHDLILSVRALDAKRKHTVLKQRALALATKVQILRNKGYNMEHDEQHLKEKLQGLERQVCDPGLSARAEEIWARMVGVRERARVLKEEIGKSTGGSDESLDEESVRRAEKVCLMWDIPGALLTNAKILEAYGQQLQHMKKEVTMIKEDFEGWQKDQPTHDR
jgi:nuclear pore complex protein Nup54